MNPFLGQIIIFGGNFAIRDWAQCNGQLLAISSYTALFSLLGTFYGGDGRTSFALPDLRGRAAIGMGTGPGLTPRGIGQRSGLEWVTLNVNEIPQHNHTVTASGVSATVAIPASTTDGTTGVPGPTVHLAKTVDLNGDEVSAYSTATADTTLAPIAAPISGAFSSGFTGASQSHFNMQPFLVVNYLIAMQGVYPSRN